MGAIGTPMALRVIDAGHELHVWGRTKQRLRPALERGAREAASAADLTRACDAVFLCVSDTDAVADVVFGADGVADGGSPGKLVIDTSTIHPLRTQDFARRLHATCGMHWVDAPVSGGAPGAREGSLSIFCGGDAADVERARPWLAAFGRNVTHMGAQGAGQVAKSCNQTILTATIAVWSEVLAYAQRCGVDAALLVQALEGSWADSAVRRQHAGAMAAGQLGTVSARLILKDLDIIGDMARATNAPMPVNALVTSLYRLLIAQGHEQTGLTGVMRLYADGPLTPGRRTETPDRPS